MQTDGAGLSTSYHLNPQEAGGLMPGMLRTFEMSGPVVRADALWDTEAVPSNSGGERGGPKPH